MFFIIGFILEPVRLRYADTVLNKHHIKFKKPQADQKPAAFLISIGSGFRVLGSGVQRFRYFSLNLEP